ncbi:MAG TPA: DUF4412 domain-containing protein [Puia sp.]|nr:DUF4412 domain-containing protein [Puia sp.]
MKRITFFAIAFGLMAAGLPDTARAQFLKSLTNNIKQTLQNRANGKANQTTNQLLDKVDSATKFHGTSTTGGPKTGTTGVTAGPGMTGNSAAAGGGIPVLGGAAGGAADTSGFARVLGAFARTAQDNPNDTNQADLVMKSLGRMAGGDEVSAQDSAAAIKSFMTASGGSGYYYETAITVTSKRGNTRDTALMWLTNSGEGRSEMRIPMPGVQMPRMIVVGHLAQPKYSVILDAQGKTYTLNVIDTAFLNSSEGGYQVTRIGTETVSGYSCIHSRLVNTTGSGAFKITNTYDVWTSTAVPGYALFSRMLSLAGSQGGIFGSLARAGAGGFLVKMTAGGGSADYSMTEVLVHAQAKNCSPSLFEIPAGYTNSETSMAQRLLSGSGPAKH